MVPQNSDGKPKGLNKSGRSWKIRRQQRASSLVTKVAANAKSKTWERKSLEREHKRLMAQQETEMKDQKRQEILDKKERRLEQEKRRMENEFRNASRQAQTLNLSSVGTTMKAMNKKQLRQIKKTRMNVKTGAVEYVPAFGSGGMK